MTQEIEFTDNFHTGIEDDYFVGSGLDKFDVAAGAQKVVEQLLRNIFERFATRQTNVVFMGGVALNCVANAMLEGHCKNLWIMPNPGDCGSSLGAAALQWGKKLRWKGHT